VAKNTPNAAAYISNSLSSQNDDAEAGQITYLVVQLENSNSVNGLAAAPTGTLTIAGAPSGTPATATLVTGVDPVTYVPESTAYFAIPATATGQYNMTVTYAGDANYTPTSSPLAVAVNLMASGALASTTSATASAAATSPSGQVQVTVQVTGQAGRAAPTGQVQLSVQGYYYEPVTLPTSSGNSATVTLGFDSANLPQGTNQIVAQYSGDSLYGSSATEFTIANPLSDFSLQPVTTILNVPGTGLNAGVQTDVINLSSYNGFTGAVNLTCAGAAGVTCSLSQTSPTLAAGGTTPITLTVNSSAAAAAGTYSVVVTGTNSTGNVIHTIGLQVVTPLVVGFNLTATPSSIAIAAPGGSGTSTVTATPTNGFTGTVDLTCAVTASPAGATSAPTCSLSAGAGTFVGTAAVSSTLTVDTLATTTAGNYTVTITAISGAVTETANVAVTVAPISFTLSGTPVTIASQGASGTSTITLSGYSGAVALTCAVTTTPSGANVADDPTCSVTSIAAGSTTATLTINTTAQTAKLTIPLKGIFTFGGGAALATMLLFGSPFGRRGRRSLSAVRTIRLLAVALLFGLIAGAGIGCGGGTTTGAYTITVTGTSGTTTATTTVAVTVN
jgi:hypothetical protein